MVGESNGEEGVAAGSERAVVVVVGNQNEEYLFSCSMVSPAGAELQSTLAAITDTREPPDLRSNLGFDAH